MSYEFAGGYKIRDQSAPHFLTFTVVNWVDVFTRERYKELVVESMRFCQESKGLKVGAFVIMSNHIHAIWTASQNNLSSIIRDFKHFTSTSIIDSIKLGIESRKAWLLPMFNQYACNNSPNQHYKLWTNNNHPEEIFSLDFLMTKLNYIHHNPVRSGWVLSPEDYLYSSAGAYQGRKGLIDIDYLI